jgi:hypothetical protein
MVSTRSKEQFTFEYYSFDENPALHGWRRNMSFNLDSVYVCDFHLGVAVTCLLNR